MNMKYKTDLPCLTHPLLSAQQHGFYSRRGGVSTGVYASLNTGLGSKDSTNFVISNRQRIADHLGSEGVVTGFQTHGIEVAEVTALSERPAADALVTQCPGIAIGVLTADCAPVLLADPGAGIIGTAHAGWKGALGGIIEAVVQSMSDLGASRENISAVIGPSISQPAYEVGTDLHQQFLEKADPADMRFFMPGKRAGHYQFNLPGFVMAQVERAHITRCAIFDQCTYTLADNYFSYRRMTHLQENDYGRQISAISLPTSPHDM